MERQICLKELAGKSKIYRMGCQAEDPTLWFKLQGLPGRRIPSCSWRSVFAEVRPSADWVRLTHIVESTLLYLKSTDLNVTLI